MVGIVAKLFAFGWKIGTHDQAAGAIFFYIR
jgi:hypothetical protein